MSLAVIVGVGILSFFMLSFAYKLDDEHSLLRYALIIFSFIQLLIIPAATVHDETVCEVVVNSSFANETTPTANETYTNTTYTYTDYCYTKENGSKALMSSFRIPYYVFWAYLIIYLFLLAITALSESFRKGGKRFNFKNVRGKL